jgi:hypothetical protein
MLRGVILTIIGSMVSLYSSAQLTGVGTLNNPYTGTLTANLTITGTKYFYGNIIVDNETLTISAGSKFIATSSDACIKIIGTGVLNAAGTAASPILISGDTDKDLINGEATDTWGDIYITSTMGSTISYCTIERGKRTDARLGSMGGGIYISNSSTTVSNTAIRYCTAIRGGGIYVAAGYSPSITACIFLANSVSESGGGMYVSSSASPVLSNDIFNANTTTSTTYKGGGLASFSASPSVVNCLFVYNTATASTGNAIYLENSTGAKIVNTAIWGGNNQIAYSGTTSSVFAYCAIQGVTYSTCLTLNSLNTASNGPNFTNPALNDYSISFDSPMRDMGTASFSGVTIPSSDYIGTLRIGKPDIGVYEMIYSRWNGTINADWARLINWANSYGPGTRNVVIPAGVTNYPVLNPGPNFTLNAGLKMIVEPGAKVTFNSLTNNGTIILKSDATGSFSLLTSSYASTSGSLTVQQYLKGGSSSPDHYRWHYIAPPATVSKTVFTNIDPYNLLMYDETKVKSTMFTGWQWHDGYDNTTGFSELVAKSGYDVYVNEDTTLTYTGLTNMVTTIGQVNLSFSGSGTDTARYGFNMVGNSLTCGINWDLVTRSDPAHVMNAIYITTNDSLATYVDGVGTNGGTAHIAPLQGFFVKTAITGSYITIPNYAKEHRTTNVLKSTTTKSLIRLSLSAKPENSSDETIIRLDENATTKFDGNFDAYKMFPVKGEKPQLFSSLEGTSYAINTIPWPATQTVIPLVLVIPSSGEYKIKRTQIQNFGDYKAYLTDKLTNTVSDLTSITEYSFTASNGTISDRFVLTIFSKNLKTTDSNVSLKAYRSGDEVSILPSGDEWDGEKCTVRIYSLSGSLLFSSVNENLYNGELKTYYPGQVNSPVIVEVIRADGSRYSKKVVFTNNK